MNERGWLSKLADAWTNLYKKREEEQLERFVSLYWIFWSEVADFFFDGTITGKVEDETKIGKIGNMKITKGIVNQTGLFFSSICLHGYSTFKVTRVGILKQNSSSPQFNQNDLPMAKVEIIENEFMGFLKNPFSHSAITPNDQSSLIVKIKKALTYRLANLLEMAGLTKWPSKKTKVVFKGNEGKFFSPYTHTTSLHHRLPLSVPSLWFSFPAAPFFIDAFGKSTRNDSISGQHLFPQMEGRNCFKMASVTVRDKRTCGRLVPQNVKTFE